MSVHIHCIFEQWVCTPLNGPSSEFFETHNGQENWQLSSLLCSVVKHRRKCVQRRQDTTCAIVFWFRRIAFLVYNTLIVTFFQELGVMESCLMITLMIPRIHSVVFSSVHLRSLALTPLKPTDFLFWAWWIQVFVSLGHRASHFKRPYCIFLLRISIFHLQQNRMVSLSSFSFIVPTWVQIFVKLCKCVCNTSPRCFDVSDFISHARDQKSFFLVLIFAIFWIPLNCWRILCTLSCFFVLLLSLNPCLIFLLMSFTSAFTFFVHILSFFDESFELFFFLLLTCSSLCHAVVVMCCCSSSLTCFCFAAAAMYSVGLFVFCVRCHCRMLVLWTCSQVQQKIRASSWARSVNTWVSLASVVSACFVHRVLLRRLSFRFGSSFWISSWAPRSLGSSTTASSKHHACWILPARAFQRSHFRIHRQEQVGRWNHPRWM